MTTTLPLELSVWNLTYAVAGSRIGLQHGACSSVIGWIGGWVGGGQVEALSFAPPGGR